MTTQEGRNLCEALVQFGRDQGQMLAQFKGEDWQGVLREMLRLTEHPQTRNEISQMLAQVDRALQVISGRPGNSN